MILRHPTRRTWPLALSLVFFLHSSVYAIDIPPPFSLPPPHELAKLQSALIQTSKGNLLVELYPQDAPWHVANLKYLADNGFYRARVFHIYEPGYIIQGGGARAGETIPYSLPPEFNRRPHEFGTLGMARVPDPVNPERRSHGTQFHILLGRAAHMDGNYTVFGKVIRGKEVLGRLRRGDIIQNVTVYVRERPVIPER